MPEAEKNPQNFFFLLHYFSSPSLSQCRRTSIFLQHPPYRKQLSYKSVSPAKGPLKDISTMPKIQGPFPCPQESQSLRGGGSGQSNRGHQAPGPDLKQKHSLCKNHPLFPWRSEKQNSWMLSTRNKGMFMENIVHFIAVYFAFSL